LADKLRQAIARILVGTLKFLEDLYYGGARLDCKHLHSWPEVSSRTSIEKLAFLILTASFSASSIGKKLHSKVEIIRIDRLHIRGLG
jgi:hypothetical protein